MNDCAILLIEELTHLAMRLKPLNCLNIADFR